MRPCLAQTAALCAVLSIAGQYSTLSASPQPVLDLLGDRIGLSDADKDLLTAGEAVVKTQRTAIKQEVAVVGVVKASGAVEVSLERLRRSLSQPKGGAVSPGARFSSPPNVGDLIGFELSEKDIEELAKCRVGSCDLNLSSEAIRRFETAAAGSNEKFAEAAPEIFREVLIGYVERYMKLGDAGLGEYSNKRKAVDLTKAHRELLADARLLKELAPELYDHLVRFPSGDWAPEISEFFWSTAEFGLKPMITLSHIASAETESELGPVYAIATKQIYATRYLDASLNFAILAPAGSSGEYYLIFADRSRSDALGGILGGLARTAVESEAIDRIRKLLSNAVADLKTPARFSANVEMPGGTEDTAYSPFDFLIRNWVSTLAVVLVLAGLGVWIVRRMRKRPSG